LVQHRTQVVVTDGQFAAVVGRGGKLGRQALPQGQGGPVGRLRLRAPPQADEQVAQAVVAGGQFPPVDGNRGEVGGQLLLCRQGCPERRLRFRTLPQRLVDPADAVPRPAGQRQILLRGRGAVGELLVIPQRPLQERPLRRQQLLLRGQE